MVKIVEKLLRAGEGRTVKRLENIAGQVNAIEEDFEKLSDAELRGETDKFKARLAAGETLDDLLPEARRHAEVLAAKPISSLVACKRVITAPVRAEPRTRTVTALRVGVVQDREGISTPCCFSIRAMAHPTTPSKPPTSPTTRTWPAGAAARAAPLSP